MDAFFRKKHQGAEFEVYLFPAKSIFFPEKLDKVFCMDWFRGANL